MVSIRLASPAERWGGFGTCVQSKAPGPHSSPNSTSSTWRRLGQRNSPPEHPTKKGLSLPRRSPGADALHEANLYARASPTRIYALQVPRCRRRGELATQNSLGIHSDLLLSYGPRSGATPPTRIRLPPTWTRIRPGKVRPDQQHTVPGARASMITSQIYRVLSQDTHTKPPASTNYDTTSRPLTDSDQETQADQSTKAATQPAVWWHHLHEPHPS